MPRNLLTEYARLFIATLVQQGIEEVIISPGSRSTPLAIAALRHPGLTCLSVVDERSAAFFALAKSKMTGRSPLLLCTSGTAGANYYPAILEAEAACVPLVVVTADRPLFLAHANAQQTTDQQHFFGRHVRFFANFVPQAEKNALRALKYQLAQAMEKAHSVFPGPVHLNFHADKPLEPITENFGPQEIKLKELVEEIVSSELIVCTPKTARLESQSHYKRACSLLEKSKRGLLLLGPLLPSRHRDTQCIERVAQKTGFCVLAESTSQFRFQTPNRQLLFPDLLSVLGQEMALPDCILQLGFPPAAISTNNLLEQHADIPRIVVCEGEWGEPFHGAGMIFHGDMQYNLQQLEQHLAPNPGQDAKWHEALYSLCKTCQQKLQEKLEQNDLTSAFVLHCLGKYLSKQHVLALGNGLSVRNADTFVPVQAQKCTVWCQRGVNGIDGLVAGAIGAIFACKGGGVAVLGDVSCLHDIGGFGLCRSLPDFNKPCVLLVMNNQGGRIFDRLPAAKIWAGKEGDFWTTPHQMNFSSVAAMFELPYLCLTQKEQVEKGIKWGLSQNRPVLVEALVQEINMASVCNELRKKAAHLAGQDTK